MKIKQLTGPAQESLRLVNNFVPQDSSTVGTSYIDALYRSQVVNGEGVEIFRAVYAQKQDKGELISGSNQLFDSASWSIISASDIDFNFFRARFLILRDLAGKEQMIIYWYDVAGEILTSKVKVKLLQAMKVYSATDSTSELIIFSMPGNDKQAFYEQVESLLLVLNDMKRELY